MDHCEVVWSTSDVKTFFLLLMVVVEMEAGKGGLQKITILALAF